MEREYTVGPSQTADTAYSLFGGHPRNRLASSAPGGAPPASPSWVISALRAALRRLRSETRLRAQSRTHPSFPAWRIYRFIDGLKTHADKTHVSFVRTSPIRSLRAEQGSGRHPSFSLHFCNKRTFSLLFPPFMLHYSRKNTLFQRRTLPCLRIPRPWISSGTNRCVF